MEQFFFRKFRRRTLSASRMTPFQFKYLLSGQKQGYLHPLYQLGPTIIPISIAERLKKIKKNKSGLCEDTSQT